MSTDRKKQKQLEQARQAGQIEPELDTETGAMINPHNPEFITKRPWYLGDSGPSLKHHSQQRKDHALSMKEADALLQSNWEKAQRAKAATVFRKGACKNCGALGHKTVECVERPRSQKKAAWKSGLDIAPDDSGVNLEEHGKVAFDAKRDRWQGYQPDDHKEVVERYNRIEEERRRKKREDQEQHEEEKQRLKAEKEQRKLAKIEAKKAAKVAASIGSASNGTRKSGGGGGGGSDDASDSDTDGKDSDASDSDSDYDSDDDDDDEDDTRDFVQKEVDQRDFQGRVARQGGLGGAQMKTTVRNLRIREDRAKYLYNLDPDSAYYDPKSRAMRDNPIPNANPEELPFAGDNFIRYGGDVTKHARTQLFAWEAAERGQELHPIADPSQAELLHRQFEEKKAKLKDDQKQSILDKYGGEKHIQAPDPRLVLGQTEAYVEYDRTGRVVRGAPKAIAKSKYEEDHFPGNHTSVWGSYYEKRSGRWGFSCCHSLTRNSYCTGEAGRKANDGANAGLGVDESAQRKMLEAKPVSERTSQAPASRADLYGAGTENPELNEEKLKEAMRKEKDFQRKAAEEDDRKRKYNSMKSVEVTAEDMEAYRMQKRNTEDPMAAISSDVLLDEEEEEQAPAAGKKSKKKS